MLSSIHCSLGVFDTDATVGQLAISGGHFHMLKKESDLNCVGGLQILDTDP